MPSPPSSPNSTPGARAVVTVDRSTTLRADERHREGVPAQRGARPDPVATPTADTLVASDALLSTLPAAPRPEAPPELAAGAQLGRYFVIRRLGAGAMGVVYAAYDPKLDRKVALKLLADLADEGTEGARQRLQREAQALAKLAHPNVVGVYDVDTHAGQLYVAMEFVAGRTLGAWMREQPRPWRAIVEVLLEAGRGLAAAHAAGLIHRDFKPENAMIGEDGRVRVMDFGLARPHGALPTLEALRSSLSGQLGPRALESRMTLTGTMMGTPAYMALEQFDGHADARSDQFSFCVALYEGLYGERPFAADSLTTLLGALASGDVRPAPRGAAVPAWLRAAVLRGLSPDPEKRWPSMDALLAALADDPARRRRRGAGVALSVALVAGSVGGAASYVQGQAHKCMGLEVRLAGVWDDAVKSRTRAAFDATELVYAADSWRGASARLDEYTQRWVTARQEACEAHQRGEQSDKLLDLRMACLDERLQHVQATLRLFEAPDEDTVRKAVEAVAGLPGLERCTDVEALAAEQPPPEDPAARARVVELNAQVIEASALERAGGYDRGLEEATRVATEAAELGYEPLQVRAWLVQGSLQDRKGAYQDAEATLERAYASAMGLTMVTEAAEAARLLVFVVGARQARHEEGRRWAKDAEPLARAAGTPGGVGGLFKNLGNVAYGEGRFDEARAFHERALAISEKALGVDHPDLASSLNNLGNVAQSEGKLDEARAYYERAWAIWEKALGPDHPDLAVTFNNLGNISAMEGKLDEARAYFERARAIFEEALGPDHPDLAASLNNLGRVAYHVGKLDEARAFHERALAIREKALGPDHPALANSLNDLGNLAALEGELDEARAYFERALALWGEALGPDHVILSRPLTGLGETLLAQGNAAEALAPLERARTLRGAPPDDPVDLAETQFALTRALWDAPEGAGRDRDRARELASLAAAAYAAAGEEAASELAEVRAWQSAHAR